MLQQEGLWERPNPALHLAAAALRSSTLQAPSAVAAGELVVRRREVSVGAALYIMEERETPGLDVGVSGKALGRSEDLDRLARAAGVRPLMEFYSYDPKWMADFIRAEGGEVPEEGLQPEEWFPAEEGLTTVRGLLAHLAAKQQQVADEAAIIKDLREFQAVLARLASAGIQWHLAVDF